MTPTDPSAAPEPAPTPPRPGPRWGFWFLVAGFVLLDAWWRGHTFGPTIRDALGTAPYPVVVGRAEPIDCDEAAYAYIGSNIDRGAVMYRDLSENKPPLGYWLYALTTAVGGMDEAAIRLMPLVPVALTVALLGGIARRLRGGVVAPAAAMGGYVLLSTDPYLYGNGANMEHFINLFGALGLRAAVRAWGEPSGSRARFGWLALAGAGVALGTLVKQVAAVQGPIFAGAVALGAIAAGPTPHRWRSIGRDWLALIVGFAGPAALAVVVVVAQGAGRDAWADVVGYGGALATIKVPDPGTPSPWVRWLTGNADPEGRLPPPFAGADYPGIVLRMALRAIGQPVPAAAPTDFVAWWGNGSWPLWLAAFPGLAWLLRPRRRPEAKADAGARPAGPDRLVAAWTLGACAETALPGLYWHHYYLLPTPGLALVVALALADALRGLVAAARGRRPGRALGAVLGASALLASLGWTARLQVRDYLMVPPELLAARYKGGGQWIVLRDLAAKIRARTDAAWPGGTDPGLFVWGWQSPLHFYGGWRSPTRHFFTDPLLADYAQGHHRADPRVRPRVERILRDLADRPPGLIWVAYPPFPELRAFLRERNYRRSPVTGLSVLSIDDLGLWVDPAHFAAFERAGVPKAPAPADPPR